MKVAIMQPYFLPYIGYWQLIHAVDGFVVYDNIEFSKSGWFNRNNILLDGKKHMFTLPLEKAPDYLNVVDRRLSPGFDRERIRILNRIRSGYAKAPYYKDIFPVIEEVIMYENRNLFEYILNSIRRICDLLKMDTELLISSTIQVDHSLKGRDKVVAINKKLSSSSYINPIGGQGLYDKEDFRREGLELSFLESGLGEYRQFTGEFVPSLSIIDVLMFNSLEEVKVMMTDYRLV